MMKEFMEVMSVKYLNNSLNQNNVMEFKIATWNANGLAKYSKKIEIFIFS